MTGKDDDLQGDLDGFFDEIEDGGVDPDAFEANEDDGDAPEEGEPISAPKKVDPAELLAGKLPDGMTPDEADALIASILGEPPTDDEAVEAIAPAEESGLVFEEFDLGLEEDLVEIAPDGVESPVAAPEEKAEDVLSTFFNEALAETAAGDAGVPVLDEPEPAAEPVETAAGAESSGEDVVRELFADAVVAPEDLAEAAAAAAAAESLAEPEAVFEEAPIESEAARELFEEAEVETAEEEAAPAASLWDIEGPVSQDDIAEFASKSAENDAEAVAEEPSEAVLEEALTEDAVVEEEMQPVEAASEEAPVEEEPVLAEAAVEEEAALADATAPEELEPVEVAAEEVPLEEEPAFAEAATEAVEEVPEPVAVEAAAGDLASEVDSAFAWADDDEEAAAEEVAEEEPVLAEAAVEEEAVAEDVFAEEEPAFAEAATDDDVAEEAPALVEAVSEAADEEELAEVLGLTAAAAGALIAAADGETSEGVAEEPEAVEDIPVVEEVEEMPVSASQRFDEELAAVAIDEESVTKELDAVAAPEEPEPVSVAAAPAAIEEDISRPWRWAALGAWGFLIWMLSTAQAGTVPEIGFPGADKLAHAAAFAVLAALLARTLQGECPARPIWLIMAASVLLAGRYGVVSECSQVYVLTRSFEHGDIIANLFGSFIGVVAWRHYPAESQSFDVGTPASA